MALLLCDAITNTLRYDGDGTGHDFRVRHAECIRGRDRQGKVPWVGTTSAQPSKHFFLYSSFTQLRLRFAPGVDGTKLGIVENIISHRITITLDSVPSAATQCCVAPFILIQRLLHKGTSLGLVRVVRSNLSCPLFSVSSPGALVPWLMFQMPTCHRPNLAVFSTRNLPSTNSHSSTALSSLPLLYSLCFATRRQNWCLCSLDSTSA